MNAIHTSHILMFLASILTVSVAAVVSGDTFVAEKPDKEDEAQPAGDARFFMLNAPWFKPDGGAEKYDEYLKAAGPFVARFGGKSDGSYVPEASIIGEFDADLVFFVEWPNQKAFTDFVQDPGYQAISHFRQEASRDSLLIRCRKN